jgi:hypothetical protein
VTNQIICKSTSFLLFRSVQLTVVLFGFVSLVVKRRFDHDDLHDRAAVALTCSLAGAELIMLVDTYSHKPQRSDSSAITDQRMETREHLLMEQSACLLHTSQSGTIALHSRRAGGMSVNLAGVSIP